MKINIIYSILKKALLLSIILLNMSGCEDYLNTPVQVVVTDENFYQTPEDAEYAVIAAYSVLKYAGSGAKPVEEGRLNSWGLIVGDIASDDAWKAGKTYTDGSEMLEISEFRYRTENELFLKFWHDAYKGVYRANLVIHKIPDIDFEGEESPAGYNLKQRYLAEARWLRAYYYFRLATMYGDVPLVTDLLAPDELAIIPSSQEDVFKLIEADLRYCMEVPAENDESGNPRIPMKNEWGPDNYGRVTLAAAKGLLAKTLLYQAKDYDIIKELCEDIIIDHSGQYNLSTPYSQIFRLETENNAESVIEFQFTESKNGKYNSSNGGNLLFIMHAGRDANTWVNSSINATKIGWGWNQPSVDLYEAFELGDPRRDFTILEEGEPYPFVPEVPVKIVCGPNNYATGLLCEKYLLPPGAMPALATDGPNNIRWMRTSDVYLMYAEAAYFLGQEEDARWAVNEVRARARTEADLAAYPEALMPLQPSLTGDELLDAIWHERRVELAMEGQRFWDLVRQSRVRPGRIARIMNSFFSGQVNADGEPMMELDNPFIEGVHEYFPIPKSETDISNGIISQ